MTKKQFNDALKALGIESHTLARHGIPKEYA